MANDHIDDSNPPYVAKLYAKYTVAFIFGADAYLVPSTPEQELQQRED